MKSQDTKDDIEYYLGFILKSLHTAGLKLSISRKTDEFKFYHKLPTIIGCSIGIIIFFLQIYFIRDALHNHTILPIQIISQVITNLQSISKGFLVVLKINKIQRILEQIGVLWKSYTPDESNRATLYSILQRTLSICKTYCAVLFVTLLIYYLQPIANFLVQYRERNGLNHTYDYTKTLLIIKVPFQVTLKRYFFIISHEAVLLYTSALYWGVSDTFFACFTTQICYHFKILKYYTKVFFDVKNNNSRLNLVTLIKRHQDLLRLCELTEDVFSPIIFSTMLSSAMNLCVNVIGVRETISNGSYRQTGMHLFLFVITFIQILFYCTFAEAMTEEACTLADLAYNLEWTSKDYKLRCYIQVIILRAQKPIYCTAYGFFPIGIQKLTSVINASFSYYMMLQTVS
ncbi:odorant receptor 281 isoform X1 [Nasonia vitripennis]|uniref:Odorant receptor n=1 Tax=Nasonia vitripennis TaxID=7425 RepID=A0A7M7QNU0_NASVI|nr:odorant receptor 281 isoform X1 [Nasonia vitripennis]